MFQNITEESYRGERCSIKEDTKINVNPILKEIFKYQNVAIYILTFLMSTVSIKNDIMPFGLAMIAACLGGTVPVIMAFISAGIGTFAVGGGSAFGSFFAVTIIYFALNLIFKPKVAIEERNEILKTGGRLFWAYIIVEFIKNIQGIFLVYDLFIGVISASLVYVFYKIFVNGLIVIKDFRLKKAFAIEELIGSVIIVAIASIAVSKVNILNLNMANIIITFMIMVLGWKNGMLLGAATGVSTGLALSLMENSDILQVSIFAISGVFAGLLNKFGKIGVIVRIHIRKLFFNLHNKWKHNYNNIF